MDSRIEYAMKEGSKIATATKHLNKEDRIKLGLCSDALEGANY